MASSEASTSYLPAYPTTSQDVLSRVDSLSAVFSPEHPVYTTLLRDINLSKDSISIWCQTETGIIVYPRQVTAHDTREGWSQASGYVLVISTTRRRIKSLTVDFVSRQSLLFPQDKGRKEDDEVFRRTVALEEQEDEHSMRGVWLEKGLNAFAYVLHLPPDMPVSLHGDSTAIHHYFVTTAVGSAKGLFGKDLVAEKNTFSLTAPADDRALILDHTSTDYHKSLGPCSLSATSSLFTVSGGILFSLDLPSPPPSLRIYAVKAYFDQTHIVTSFRSPSKTMTIKRKRYLLERGWEGPYTSKAIETLNDGEGVMFDAGAGSSTDGWKLEEVGRIGPDHVYPPRGNPSDSVSPSTHPDTKTSIQTSQELVVDLYFTIGDGTSLKIAQVLRKPVWLNSCGCLRERLTLPGYAPTPKPYVPLTLSAPCRCDESTESVVEGEWAHWRALQAASQGGERGDLSPAPGRGGGNGGIKIGETYAT